MTITLTEKERKQMGGKETNFRDLFYCFTDKLNTMSGQPTRNNYEA